MTGYISKRIALTRNKSLFFSKIKKLDSIIRVWLKMPITIGIAVCVFFVSRLRPSRLNLFLLLSRCFMENPK